MAIINYTDQLKYAGKGYLDAKMMPVKTVDDLKAISLTQRFEGFTVTVLNDGNPQDYWLVGGISNKNWVPKTSSTNFSELRLVLEDGFLKLMNGSELLGDAIDFNDFFPENPEQPTEPYIVSVDYSTVNENGDNGIFMCFVYSDETKKYLDMSQFLSKTYEAGSGVVIDGNLISIDSAILGEIEKIKTIESEISIVRDDIASISYQLSQEVDNRTNAINNIKSRLDEVATTVKNNTTAISENTADILALTERVNALSSAAEGSTPDGETIGITNDESKSLYVKILNKEGNMISKEVNENGESGLYASIPIFFEDDEL